MSLSLRSPPSGYLAGLPRPKRRLAVYQYLRKSSQQAKIFLTGWTRMNTDEPGALDVGRSMLVVGCFGCGFAAPRYAKHVPDGRGNSQTAFGRLELALILATSTPEFVFSD
jgi:hypothetical protein